MRYWFIGAGLFISLAFMIVMTNCAIVAPDIKVSSRSQEGNLQTQDDSSEAIPVPTPTSSQSATPSDIPKGTDSTKREDPL